MLKIATEDELDEFVRSRFYAEVAEDRGRFESALKEYLLLKPFRVNQNIKESSQKISDDAHFVMRLVATFYMKEALLSLKIDLEDENIREDLQNGNIGTAGRIVKMYSGSTLKDERELLSGRWSDEPRMATFKNSNKNSSPVFVTTKLDAVCSHHFIRFGADRYSDASTVVVGYIPRDKLGGISKINRFVNWCARRGWLQEELTEYIGKKIERVFETDSVFVALLDIRHGCTAYRGACDEEASVSTLYKSGEFSTDDTLVPHRFCS